MKKFVMGLIIGAVLSFTVSANAEEIKSLIGKQVEGQVAVIVDGQEISVPAAIIGGVSYAPVRAVGEAVGREVGWEEGKVILNSSKEVDPVTTVKTERGLKMQELRNQMLEIEKKNEPYVEIIMKYEITAPGMRINTEEEYLDAKKKIEETKGKYDELYSQFKALIGQ